MRKIKKIMFVLPNTKWFGLKKWHTFPYSIGLLIAVLKKEGYMIKVLDAELNDLSFDEVEGGIREYNPDVVAISCMSMEYSEGFKKIASITKSVSQEIT
ncbi:cobalamin B12-binding domain-containing protein, partial [Candidatus Woesearchaeota archaeon]|nr:cobalamin B12-binding domain-containing protein [Candidatus Woesearchaeota archaeon]